MSRRIWNRNQRKAWSRLKNHTNNSNQAMNTPPPPPQWQGLWCRASLHQIIQLWWRANPTVCTKLAVKHWKKFSKTLCIPWRIETHHCRLLTWSSSLVFRRQTEVHTYSFLKGDSSASMRHRCKTRKNWCLCFWPKTKWKSKKRTPASLSSLILKFHASARSLKKKYS